MPQAFERRLAPNGVTSIVCPALGVPHGFSTRRGGESAGDFAGLNLGMSAGDDPTAVLANRLRWIAALGFGSPVYTVHQVHGADVHVLAADETEPAAAHKADALTTALPRQPIGVFTADCAPILLSTPARPGGAVAAVHAGWRGTVAGIAGRAVETMARAHGVAPADMVAAIGPAIGPCCFEVGEEVAQAFRDAGLGDAVVPKAPRPHLDLFIANAKLLEAAGVGAVHASGICTACDEDLYYSWRRDGQRTGRMMSAIAPA